MTTEPAVEDCRRSDARRNHERIIAAALEVFAEKGPDASIPEIAARAGVGKATVYRNYPTKADLLTAITTDRRRWLAERAERAAFEADTDAWSALRSFTDDVVTHIKSDRVLSEALRDEQSPATAVARAHVRELLEVVLRRGQEQGTIRADVTPDDLRILLSGLTEQLHREGETDRAVWRRYASLAMDALRPPG